MPIAVRFQGVSPISLHAVCFDSMTLSPPVLVESTNFRQMNGWNLIKSPNNALEIITEHDDVINWKHFPRHWPFVRGIHRSSVNSPHKDQWRGALIFFYLHPNERLSKQSRRRWFEAPSRSLWRHCNGIRDGNWISAVLQYSILFTNIHSPFSSMGGSNAQRKLSSFSINVPYGGILLTVNLTKITLVTRLVVVLVDDVDSILPKGPYPPCLRMADRALLAGYPRCPVSGSVGDVTMLLLP